MKFPFLTKQDLKEYDSDIHETFGTFLQELAKLSHRIDDFSLKSPPNPPEYASRIADLEVKMAKLWDLLVETTPAGKDKLSKFGRKFGGRSKGTYTNS